MHYIKRMSYNAQSAKYLKGGVKKLPWKGVKYRRMAQGVADLHPDSQMTLNDKLEKKMKRILGLMVILLATLSLSSNGLCATVIVKDTPTELEVTWDWNPEVNFSNTVTGLINWQNVSLSIDNTVPAAGSVNWTFQHLVAPHPGDITPGTLFAGAAAVNFTTQWGYVVNESGSILHETTHYDEWTFLFDRSMDPSASSITLTVSHVPLPCSAWLVGSGLLGLLGIKRRT